ncbi:MAG TPA: hypothetical protein PLQ54_12135 [Armatimonadota bacterium]|nr:hypothetical protein [Armatimonadota bacterium]
MASMVQFVRASLATTQWQLSAYIPLVMVQAWRSWTSFTLARAVLRSLATARPAVHPAWLSLQ